MKLPNIFKQEFTKEDAARILKTDPNTLSQFEQAYKYAQMREDRNDAAISAKQAAEKIGRTSGSEISDRIVDELLAISEKRLPEKDIVTMDDIETLHGDNRPQLTGTLIKKDIEIPAYPIVLEMLDKYMKTGDITAYHLFRQGLDVLDLDPVLYEIIGMNRNSIGHWFPALKASAEKEGFFKVPKTTIVKVPLSILQLTHINYLDLTPATLDIVNRWAFEAFGLDENKGYFVKTGTYSDKYDFRNAKVTDPAEVREIGSYLLYIHFKALQMAQPLSVPCIYGASTTNEWCVREYIRDTENNPCIYHGMPLHTEYRVFVDCDSDEVLGIAPYWEPNIMKKRFSKESDSETADMIHDYVIYLSHEEVLMKRYEDNKEIVVNHIKNMLPYLDLKGQWSIDIMQNGDDFWLIDMGLAENSALKEYVPKGLLKHYPENWIPKLY